MLTYFGWKCFHRLEHCADRGLHELKHGLNEFLMDLNTNRRRGGQTSTSSWTKTSPRFQGLHGPQRVLDGLKHRPQWVLYRIKHRFNEFLDGLQQRPQWVLDGMNKGLVFSQLEHWPRRVSRTWTWTSTVSLRSWTQTLPSFSRSSHWLRQVLDGSWTQTLPSSRI